MQSCCEKQSFVSRRVFARTWTLPLTYLGCSLSHPACGVDPEPVEMATPQPQVTLPSRLAEAAETLTGTWRCSGAVHGPDGPAPSEVEVRLDGKLDDAWLQAGFSVSSGKDAYNFTLHRTFHPSSNQWLNVIVDNLAGHTMGFVYGRCHLDG